MTRETLLPTNRTAFEESFDKTGTRVDELPVDIGKIVRPYDVPSPFLPFVAWGLSVDLWEKEWTEVKHRALAARSLVRHQRKGTAASIADHIAIMGGEVLREIVPPAKTFLLPQFTEGEREEYLARFAQLRVYPFVERGFYKFAHFTSKAYGRNKAFLGACYVEDVGAWQRYIRTAKLVDGGVTTNLTIRAVQQETVGRFVANDYDEVVLPSQPTAAIHLDAPPKARSFLVDDFGVRKRLVRIARNADYTYRLGRETYTTITPDAGLIDVRPQSVNERHAGQPGALYGARGQFIAGKHLPPTIAWRFIYERWHLLDPDRVPDERRRSTHLGYTRLGMPPYHAELRVRIKGKRPPRAISRYVNGFLHTSTTKPISDTREAIRVSKSLRDKIWIDTKTWRPPRVGDRIRLGSLTVGSYIEA